MSEAIDNLLDRISALRKYVESINEECAWINSKTSQFLEESPTQKEVMVLKIAIFSLCVKVRAWQDNLNFFNLAETLPVAMSNLRDNYERLKKNEVDLQKKVGAPRKKKNSKNDFTRFYKRTPKL